MSVQGELYRSYDSWIDGGSAGVQQRNPDFVAQNFVQNFGGYGIHVPTPQQAPPRKARGCGVGMRIEVNQDREFYVSNVSKNGSADRDGTLRPGDVLVSIDGHSLLGLTMKQLKPLILGPKGTYVKLGIKRMVDDEDGLGQIAAAFGVELVRGDAMFFLQGENKAVQTKVGQLKKELVEVELELDGLRGVLKQAEGRSKLSQREVEAIQNRYQSIQNVIEKCNSQITQEKRMQLEHTQEIREPQAASDEAKAHVRQLHESLTRIEVQLSQVMRDLEGEQHLAWDLQEQCEKERRQSEMLEEKVRQHVTFASEAEAQDQERKIEYARTLKEVAAESEQLRLLAAELRAQPHGEGLGEAQARVAETEQGLQDAQYEAQRTSMKLQMVQQVLGALKEEDSKGKAALRHLEDMRDRARVVEKSKEDAIGEAHKTMEQQAASWASDHQAVVDERAAGKEAAEKREVILVSKIKSLGEQNVNMQGLARDVLLKMEQKDHEIGTRSLDKQGLLEQRKMDTKSLQQLVDATSEKLSAAQRDVAEYSREGVALKAQSKALSDRANASKERAEAAEAEMREGIKRNNARSHFAEAMIEQYKEDEDRADAEVAKVRAEGATLEKEAAGCQTEIQKCRDAIDKLGQHQVSLQTRQGKFMELHARAVQRASRELLHAREQMRPLVEALGRGTDPNVVFAAAREATQHVHASVHNLELLRGEVYKQRQLEATRSAAASAAAAVTLGPSHRALELIASAEEADGVDWRTGGVLGYGGAAGEIGAGGRGYGAGTGSWGMAQVDQHIAPPPAMASPNHTAPSSYTEELLFRAKAAAGGGGFNVSASPTRARYSGVLRGGHQDGGISPRSYVPDPRSWYASTGPPTQWAPSLSAPSIGGESSLYSSLSAPVDSEGPAPRQATEVLRSALVTVQAGEEPPPADFSLVR